MDDTSSASDGFLDYSNISFQTGASIGQLCEELNNIIRHGIWHKTFQYRNTKWLWLVNGIVTIMKSDTVLCGSFGLYPSYVAGLLNSVEEIHFYVLCNEKLNYGNYVEKYIASRECILTYLPELKLTFFREQNFRLDFDGKTVSISFVARQFPNLPSEVVFAENILSKMELSSLTYGIVKINKHITYINNEVLTSRHDCVFERYTCDLDLPKTLAGCNLYTKYCSMYPKNTCPFYILYCTKKSHRLFKETQCHCKLCIKDGPASLESQCVNLLQILI